MSYAFMMRDELSPGFRENSRHPELPAAVEYLKQFQERNFETPEKFKQALGGFSDYLSQQRIPPSIDSEMRKGLMLFENGYVGFRTSDQPGECHLGALEEILRK